MSAGDEQTALAAFRDEQLPRVRAYVAAVCSPEHSDEAVSAAFVEFLARVGGGAAAGRTASGDREPTSEDELLGATRSAAAGRFLVVVPQDRPELSLTAECRAMPELLAVYANGERPGDEALIASHLAGCVICAHTLTRIQEAERAFGRGSGELPPLDIEVTTVDTTRFASAPAPPPAARSSADEEPSAPSAAHRPNPRPQPKTTAAEGPPRHEPPSDPAATYRRRSGGLAGAIRNRRRATRS